MDAVKNITEKNADAAISDSVEAFSKVHINGRLSFVPSDLIGWYTFQKGGMVGMKF